MAVIRTRGAAVLVGLLALMAAIIAPSIAAADVASSEVPADLKVAIKTVVDSRGAEYVGLCRDINQDANLLKTCAYVQTLTAAKAEVTFGQVFSDEIYKATFVKQNGAWALSGSVVRAQTPGAPNTGSGTVGGSSAGASMLTFMVVAALVGSLGLSAGLATRKR